MLLLSLLRIGISDVLLLPCHPKGSHYPCVLVLHGVVHAPVKTLPTRPAVSKVRETSTSVSFI